jgi:RNA ligase
LNVDINALDELVRQGYLSAQRHPAADLLIYNYTAKAQYERYWTPETIACRGLIVTPRGAVVARPFPKFFNLGVFGG